MYTITYRKKHLKYINSSAGILLFENRYTKITTGGIYN